MTTEMELPPTVLYTVGPEQRQANASAHGSTAGWYRLQLEEQIGGLPGVVFRFYAS